MGIPTEALIWRWITNIYSGDRGGSSGYGVNACPEVNFEEELIHLV
jgi:hypothetical protein